MMRNTFIHIHGDNDSAARWRERRALSRNGDREIVEFLRRITRAAATGGPDPASKLELVQSALNGVGLRNFNMERVL